MKTICGFNILGRNGNLNAWFLPVDFETLPNFDKMEIFIEDVNRGTDHEVIECFAMCDEEMNVIYSKGILSKEDYEIINVMSGRV